jgi:glycosyltransferase involved in cell wall biosynthesis
VGRNILRRRIAGTLRAALVRWARGGRPSEPAARRQVYILLMHAWGMGGTIRTALNVAGYLARQHDVEILSLVRRRDEPFFPFPPGVRVTAIDDQRPSATAGVSRLPRRCLAALGSVLMHPADRARRQGSLWTDIALARALRRRNRGVMIGTRPGLNLLVASVAPPSLVRIGQEHMNLSAHPPAVRRAIADGYPQLDAVVTLTETDLAAYRAAVGQGPLVTAIPNAAPDLGAGRSDGTARTVIAAGRLTPQKGFGRLITAFAHVARVHPDWKLLICGRGPRRKHLLKLVADLSLADNVVLAGPVPRIGEAMADASIFGLSSHFEGFPMVLLEAMSVGLPVVSFDCPTGPRELVEDRVNGLLVPEGDVAALGAALVEMIDDEELRRRCSQGAIATAERYSLDRIGPMWDRLVAVLTVGESRTSTPAGVSALVA